jgi:hypothetical protein
MDGGTVREHALARPGAWADEPWEGDEVAKVGPRDGGKIFCFLGSESIGLKSGATRGCTVRSRTRSSSRPSTTPTGWSSASWRSGTDPRGGTDD